MAVDNSRFLAITKQPPNISTGWQIRVLDYKDMSTLVSICTDFDSFSFTQQLNDPGTGSITMDTDSPWWNQRLNNGVPAHSLKDNEYVFEAWEGGIPRFAWLGQTVTETVIGADEAHVTTISGPGIAQTLTWACIQRPGWPKHPPRVGWTPQHKPLYRAHSASDALPAFIWKFPMKASTMQMWYTVFRAAQRRGLIRFVKPQFSATKDTAGKAWYWVKTQQVIAENEGFQPPQHSESLLDFLNDCTGQDPTTWFGQRLEWIMYPGFKLNVQTRIGVDRSNSVRFFTGQVLQNDRTRDREQIFNRITAVDDIGEESVRTDAASVRKWNLREQRNETNKNVEITTLRGNLADIYLQQTSQEASEWTIKIPYDDGTGGRVPFHHFYVGDHVGFTDDANAVRIDKYRVMAISLSLANDQTVPDVELTLQSIIDAHTIDLQKQITKLINNPRIIGLNDLKDIAIPAEPDVRSGLVWDPELKKWVPVPVSEFGTPGSGDGTVTSGPNVYIMNVDPTTVASNIVQNGDFWLETFD